MKQTYIFCLCVLAAATLWGCRDDIQGKQLEAGFTDTPDSIKISAYWYWISDHISHEGVVEDLKAMKEAGIGRAYIGNIGIGDLDKGTGRVRFGTDEWWDILHTALKTATELGIEIGIFNSPGWSQSGGPWVKPGEAMRYLASTQTAVEGGRRVRISLPRPQKPFAEDFQDVKVLAYPVVKGKTHVEKNMMSLIQNGESINYFNFPDPFTLRSLKIFTSSVPINSPARIEVMEGGGWRTLAEFRIDRFNAALNVGFDPHAPVVVSVPETTATTFRLAVTDMAAGSWLERFELSSVPAVERYPEKTLAKMYQTPLPYWHEYMWRDQPVADDPSLVVDPAAVVDISRYFDGEILTWDAPAGDWIVMRTGMLPTGVTNSPAGPEGTGLEADKMSKEHIRSHFDAFMGEIIRRIPAEDRRSWKVVVQDSYETGGQNFTDDFLKDFEECYGYSAVPYLPVYDGVVVGSEDISDRFLWDVRRLVADKVAYDYVGGLRDVCHEHGLTTWLENYGHWGFPGEFLQYGGQSDEIGGEFWSEGELGDIENRAASSCGHIYGKNRIYAESFTAGGGGFHRYPAMMKQRGDRFFTEGINSTLLHVVISQPYEDREPGVNAWFGNEFNRKNTWYPHMHLFTEYLKRTNYMLQQGINIADAAYFIGEDAPKMTGAADPALPKGYQFDYINAEVLIRDAFVKDGMLTLPHGTQYRILVLPKQETMRPEMLAKLERLILDGAIILGPAPKRSPSMQNYPEADRLITEAAGRLWSKIDPAKKYADIGNGKLIDGMDMTEAFALIGCPPDMSAAPGEPLLYGHRRLKGIDIYFVSNQSGETITAAPGFRVKMMKPELWDAVSGEIRDIGSFSQTETGTVVPLKLAPYESAFIVFRSKAGEMPTPADVSVNYGYTETIAEPDGAWTVKFDAAKRGPSEPVTMEKLQDISRSDDPGIRYYSGMLTYENTFELPKVPEGRVFADLGALTAMAKVWINGEYAGGAWTPPYRVDITGLVKQGRNELTVEVTTTWRNRLIGDLNLPESERRTWLTAQPWKADSPLDQSGLMGPVMIGNSK